MWNDLRFHVPGMPFQRREWATFSYHVNINRKCRSQFPVPRSIVPGTLVIMGYPCIRLQSNHSGNARRCGHHPLPSIRPLPPTPQPPNSNSPVQTEIRIISSKVSALTLNSLLTFSLPTCVRLREEDDGGCKEHGPIRPLFVILVIV